MVYDAEDGSWKHFNPMRQRSAGRSDVHYNEALVLVRKTLCFCFGWCNVCSTYLKLFTVDRFLCDRRSVCHL